MDEEQTESESPQAQLAPLGPGIAKISHAPIFSVRYGDDGQPLAIHCSNVLPEGYTEVDEAAYREAEAGLARALPEMPPPPRICKPC